jgi:hypothetical protein
MLTSPPTRRCRRLTAQVLITLKVRLRIPYSEHTPRVQSRLRDSTFAHLQLALPAAGAFSALHARGAQLRPLARELTTPQLRSALACLLAIREPEISSTLTAIATLQQLHQLALAILPQQR